MARLFAVLVSLVTLAGCSSSKKQPTPDEPATPIANTTPNQFYARGAPTFITGTAGDGRSDRAIAAQIELIRGMLFAQSTVVEDRAVDAWPSNPVVYGGAHVNGLVAKAAATLPFELTPGKLVIGGRTFEGAAYVLITVVPAAKDRPELLLYAGTGRPGIGEINGVSHGPAPILVADAFGPLVAGRWERGDDGGIRARLDPAARRIKWRTVVRDHVAFQFPESLPPADDESAVVDACVRGVATAVRKLAIEAPAAIDVYVYPDHGSKKSLTGNVGDGHAVAFAGALHVVAMGNLEGLVAHEATHLLAYEAWGPAGTPLLGEGLAVWASGAYAGKPLAQYRAGFSDPPSVAELLGPAFRKLPEPTSYPLAGLFVEVAAREVGVANLREHLLGATAATWDRACGLAGTTPTRLETAFASYFK